MKTGIHPNQVACTISCICGATLNTFSSKAKIRVDICSKCHPYYTGEQSKIIDTAGRVESFRRRYGLTAKSS